MFRKQYQRITCTRLPVITTRLTRPREIPLIDFAAFLSGDSSAKQETANAILSGFQRAGFIYLRNHGIDKETVARSFALSAEFFKRPLAQKEELSWTTPEANRGYVRQGREKTSDCVDENDVDQQRALEGEDVRGQGPLMRPC